MRQWHRWRGLMILVVSTVVNERWLSYGQGHNEVRWSQGQETSLAPPCSNLRSFGNKFTVLKNVHVTILELFGAPAMIQGPPNDSASGELYPLSPSLRPCVWVQKAVTGSVCKLRHQCTQSVQSYKPWEVQEASVMSSSIGQNKTYPNFE